MQLASFVLAFAFLLNTTLSHSQQLGEPYLDLRDGNVYPTAWIDSTQWMTQNLRWKSQGSFPAKDSLTGRYYPMLERDSVCPAPWRIPTSGELDELMHAILPQVEWKVDSLERMFVWFSTDTTGLFTDSLFNLEPTGWREGAWIRNKGTLTWWIAPHTELGADPRLHVHAADGSYLRHAHDHHIEVAPRKQRKFVIRCVRKEEDATQ